MNACVKIGFEKKGNDVQDPKFCSLQKEAMAVEFGLIALILLFPSLKGW